MSWLLEEIKSRRIARALTIYLGSGWVCLEALNFFIEKYGWADWLFQASLYLALAGIPFVVVSTWYHGQPGNQKFQRKEIVLYSLNVLLAIFLVWTATQEGSTLPRKKIEISDRSIAVLPFRNLNNDPKEDFMADGMTEDIISRISQIADFKVISRTSSFHYKNTTLTLPEIGKELQVANVLEGSMQHSGETVRISVKLVNAETDVTLWVKVFDRQVNEIFKVQSEVADQIANSLKLKLSPSEKERLGDAPDFNLEAYNYYQKGLSSMRSGESVDTLQKALYYFRRSIELDSSFYLSFVGMAETYVDFAFWGRSSGAAIADSARRVAQRALELNNQSGKVYGILAAIALNFDQDAQTFEKYCRRAIALEPNYAILYDYMAEYHCFEGNTELAIEYIDKAIEFDPMFTRYRVYKGQVYLFGREFDKAESTLREALAAAPNDNYALFVTGTLYATQKKYDLAIKTFQQRSVGTSTNWALGLTYGLAGKKDDAERVFRFLDERAKVQYVPPAALGYANYSVGKNEEAIKQFEKHIYHRYGGMSWYQFIKYDPLLDSFRQDPRFKKLIEKMNF